MDLQRFLEGKGRPKRGIFETRRGAEQGGNCTPLAHLRMVKNKGAQMNNAGLLWAVP